MLLQIAQSRVSAVSGAGTVYLTRGTDRTRRYILRQLVKEDMQRLIDSIHWEREQQHFVRGMLSLLWNCYYLQGTASSSCLALRPC